MTLSEWLDRWLEQMALTLRPGTLKRYRGDMGRHVKPRLGQKKLTQLTAEDLWDLYRELQDRGRIAPRSGQSLGLSPTTVHGIHAVLHHLCEQIVSIDVNVHIERVVASISDTELLDKITECVKIQIGAYEKYN